MKGNAKHQIYLELELRKALRFRVPKGVKLTLMLMRTARITVMAVPVKMAIMIAI